MAASRSPPALRYLTASGKASAVGGQGGTNANNTGGDVTINHTGTIMTAGDQSDAILAQSVGGGGGNGGFAIAGALSTGGGTASTATGGAGGSGNAAGNVSVTSSAIDRN